MKYGVFLEHWSENLGWRARRAVTIPVYFKFTQDWSETIVNTNKKVVF